MYRGRRTGNSRFRRACKVRALKNNFRIGLLSFSLYAAYSIWAQLTPSSLNLHVNHTIAGHALSVARDIQRMYGFVFVMYVDAAFLPMTRSWLCHTDTQVIEQTLFVTSTLLVSEGLNSSGARHVYSLGHFEQQTGSAYGQKIYYETVFKRAHFILELLRDGITLWIIESDSVWFGDPSPVLRNFRGQDVIAGQDGDLNDRIPEGGFLFLNSTSHTIVLWESLVNWQSKILGNSREAEIGDLGNEMLQLPHLLKSSNCTWSFFPVDSFVSGKWYSSSAMRKQSTPLVIQNNWIVGLESKVKRAQSWGHWYLSPNGERCI